MKATRRGKARKIPASHRKNWTGGQALLIPFRDCYGYRDVLLTRRAAADLIKILTNFLLTATVSEGSGDA